LYGGIDGKENGFVSWRQLDWEVEKFEMAAKNEHDLKFGRFRGERDEIKNLFG
jgi:hypothetical protein